MAEYECLIVSYDGGLYPVILPVANCPAWCRVVKGEGKECPEWCHVGGPNWDKGKEIERQVREHLSREAEQMEDYFSICSILSRLDEEDEYDYGSEEHYRNRLELGRVTPNVLSRRGASCTAKWFKKSLTCAVRDFFRL